MVSPGFFIDAYKKSQDRYRKWYQQYLMPALLEAKENQVREIDTSIALAKQLLELLNEPVAKPIAVPPHEVIPAEEDCLMTPIEPEILDLLYGTEKGITERYLDARCKKRPDERFCYRLATSWDYGWQQKQSRVRPRDVNRGRCAILRDTFYRRNNVAPDPPHYAQPSGGEISICSEYSCKPN